MISDEQKTELIAIIEKEIEKLTKKIEELKNFTKPVAPDDAIGRISRMDAINNKSIYDAGVRNTKNRLVQLQNTLGQKNNETFGVCIKCHQNIPFERLRIRPEIRFCANCLNKKQ